MRGKGEGVGLASDACAQLLDKTWGNAGILSFDGPGQSILYVLKAEKRRTG